jgi:parallel beta-helix repeat protein
MGRKVIAIWLCMAMILGLFVIVDVTRDFTINVGGTTLYVNVTGSGGAYTSIQDAINAADDGDTVFVFNGTYYENVVVNKTINLTGEERDNTTIDGGNFGDVLRIEANWVNITYFTLTHCGSGSKDAGIDIYSSNNSIFFNNILYSNSGIYLDNSNSNHIIGNNIQSSGSGMYIYYSNDNFFTNNNVSNNSHGFNLYYSENNNISDNVISVLFEGISVLHSDRNDIYNNTFDCNKHGIYMFYSFSTNVSNNIFNNNGIVIEGDSLKYWETHTIDTLNKVNGKTIYFIKNQDGGTLSSDLGQVILVNCTNIIVENTQFSIVQIGIQVVFSSNNSILNNEFNNIGTYGLHLYYSHNNNISGNQGSYLLETMRITYSNENIISNNSFIHNYRYPIYLSNSINNIIYNNTLTDSTGAVGLTLEDCNGNHIEANMISTNKNGIIFLNSHGNRIINNTLFSSTFYAIHLDKSNNNDINDNIIFDNPYAIRTDDATFINISGNNVSSNFAAGIIVSGSNNVRVTGNSVFENFDYGIALMGCYNINVSGNSVNNQRIGIIISGSETGFISDNELANNSIGIELASSVGFNLTKNTMIEDGLLLEGLSQSHWDTHSIDISNTINGKTIYYWKNRTTGELPLDAGQVILANCTKVIVRYQEIFNCTVGIELGFSQNITITRNNVSYTNDFGTYMQDSHWINYIANNLKMNVGIGLRLFNSRNNTFYHNNFIDNSLQAYVDKSSQYDNQWDDGYPSGGNYWSDYSGQDNFKGPNQNIPGHDGIGDTNYTVDTDSIDHYPLKKYYAYKPLENFTILNKGWNLISIPLIQEEQNLTRVLGSIDSWYDAIQWYDNSDPNDSWNHNKVDKPFGNDLFELNESMGFWIHITQPGDTIFLYNGTQPTQNQTIHLHPGWNMVGYPSLTSYNRTEGLNNLTFDDQVDAIWSYDAATQKWEEMGESDYFEIGKGYYIHAKSECEWEVPL